VISLRDREEVAKRVLSNKRVGTILLEMGVLDETDLRAMVREQLSEIVFDTMRWDDGEYVFLPGDLPTFEDITLDESMEDLWRPGSGASRPGRGWERGAALPTPCSSSRRTTWRCSIACGWGRTPGTWPRR
jgi:hypothetical protein